jgi:hypothetical protein
MGFSLEGFAQQLQGRVHEKAEIATRTLLCFPVTITERQSFRDLRTFRFLTRTPKPD